jgi:hypothetical protein
MRSARSDISVDGAFENNISALRMVTFTAIEGTPSVFVTLKRAARRKSRSDSQRALPRCSLLAASPLQTALSSTAQRYFVHTISAPHIVPVALYSAGTLDTG